ncbi:hydroxyisourate hydrolase [uncultured Gilvimarinus sp.]|uniref:hydroxyisourate hydrolase n=1 Tax=uncultured Gilvimarinus sp. TaxID=1689143 RepID=UPI0030ED2312
MAALAADNPLSVHVLNTQNGLPGPDIQVTLERQQDDQWIMLESGRTNAQGRITALYPSDKKLVEGIYRVTFKTGAWLKQQETPTFFPEIPVVFQIDGALDHYHIPLLLSPYGYSTYRGN